MFVYDPKVENDRIMDDLKTLLQSNNESKNEIESKLNRVNVVSDYKMCFHQSSCIAILTEWDEFTEYNWEELVKSMEKQHVIMDGRNLLDKIEMKNITDKYYSIGR